MEEEMFRFVSELLSFNLLQDHGDRYVLGILGTKYGAVTDMAVDIIKLEGFCIHMFYIKPVRYSGQINKGQKIGVMLPMQRVYPDPSLETTTLVNQMKMLIIRTIIVAPLISSVGAGPWGQICAGNPSIKVRGCDRHGCDYYGAP
ncbi:hypothetical protein KIL84_015503, partial [Mauremys mutica]